MPADGKSYRDLEVWNEAMNLVVAVYQVTRSFPDIERYALTQQVQRAAVSIPSTIAEGHGRRRPGEFKYHLRIAHGSLCELETQLILAVRLSYVHAKQLDELTLQLKVVGRLLNGLLRYLEHETA